jgi:DNA-binding NarL/FixJ family response regulator
VAACSVGSSSRPPPGRMTGGVWRSRPASRPELVGRHSELAQLEAEFARTGAGELRVVLVVGDQGVGKSQLGRELLARHGASGGLFARAHPLGTSAAFGLWVEALAPALELLSDEELIEACGGVLDDLASLFVRVASVRGSVPDRDPPVPRLLQGLGRLLGNLTRSVPLIVVLDDVQFADASSWEALRYFARYHDDARLLVVVTSRPAELSRHEIAPQVLFELDEDGLMSRVQLEPLERPALSELAEAVVGRPPPVALVDWVAERSQGNPLYAIGLLRALLDERADLSAPSLQRLPEGLTERVAGRVRRLGPQLRETLELLAVLGRPISLSQLTELADTPLDRIGATLAGLQDAGVMFEEERGRELSYELQHPMVRDAIYQVTPRVRRRALHRQVARWLRSRGHLAEAALHFARSAEQGDDEAVEVLLDAMRQAEQREAFPEALDLQAELVELLPNDDERWLEVLDAMYWRAEWLVDHRAETHAPVAVRALRAIDALLAGTSDHARRAAVNFRLANFLAWGTGELEAAQDACEQARELFTRAGEEHQALLAAREVGWIKGLRGDLVGMSEDAKQVVRAAQARNDRFAEMQGLAAVGYSANFRGAFAEGEQALRRAAMIARQDEKTYRLTVVLGVLAAGIAGQGRAAECPALFEEAKVANPAYRDSILLELEALARWIAGDFEASRTLAGDAVAWVGAPTRRRAFGMVFGGLSAVETGDIVQAEALIRAARDVVGDRRWQSFPPMLDWAEGILEWRAGRTGQCVAKLRPAAAGLLDMHARKWTAYVLFDLAEAAAEAGEAATAAAAAADFDTVARFVGIPMYRGLAGTASAWAHLAAGQREDAVEAARNAVEGLALTACRAHLARAHYALGRALPDEARPEAVAALEQAAALLEQCGSRWRRGRALDALRRLGSAGRRAAAAALGPDSLTRREREVARLAATGMSAKDIAGALFVGERTVESHLASTYAKLGVSSKMELIRRSAELGFM